MFLHTAWQWLFTLTEKCSCFFFNLIRVYVVFDRVYVGFILTVKTMRMNHLKIKIYHINIYSCVQYFAQSVINTIIHSVCPFVLRWSAQKFVSKFPCVLPSWHYRSLAGYYFQPIHAFVSLKQAQWSTVWVPSWSTAQHMCICNSWHYPAQKARPAHQVTVKPK
jgi:hypothetical protein